MEMLDALLPGCEVLADRAYDSNAIRNLIATQGANAVIPSMPQRNPSIPHDPERYKNRNCVERFFNKLKNFRAIATRYDKRDDNFLASAQLASIRIWLRSYESVASDLDTAPPVDPRMCSGRRRPYLMRASVVGSNSIAVPSVSPKPTRSPVLAAIWPRASTTMRSPVSATR